MSDHDVRGKSLLDLLWAELDQFVDAVQEIAEVESDYLPEHFAEAKGRAHAAAVCVALVTNPYHPDVDSIKSDAMERWEMRQGISDYQEKLVQKAVRTHNERTGLQLTPAERRARRLARRAARNS